MAAGKESSTKLDALMENMPDLHQRFFWGILLAVIAVFIIYFSPALFTTMVVMIAIMMAFEWANIVSSDKENVVKWHTKGLVYIGLPCLAVLWLRSGPNGADIVMWMFAVIWATDTAAYFVGKSLGGPKLAPKISPKKTWSGLIGGVVASMVVGAVSSLMFAGGLTFFMWISAMLAILAQGGDLIESKVKRQFGVKDSGNLIPGHGGLLDRLDGMTLVAPFIMIMVMLSEAKFM